MADRLEVLPDAPNDLVRPFLLTDRIWNCFSLADLEPPHREYARVPVALASDGSIVAACLIYERSGMGSLVPFGSPAGIRVILAAVELPAEALLMLHEDEWTLVEERFEPLEPPKPILRMALTASQLRPPPTPHGISIVPLGPSDHPEVDVLFAQWPGSRMAAAHFLDGPIYGARDADGALLAVSAAMVANPVDGIGVIGGVFTRVDARGRGLAKATTGAVAARIFATGCDLAVLNVIVGNEAAHRAYLALGFTDRLRYVRVQARRR
jgi:RimJ/RimL family protein N-acetyltransferase